MKIEREKILRGYKKEHRKWLLMMSKKYILDDDLKHFWAIVKHSQNNKFLSNPTQKIKLFLILSSSYDWNSDNKLTVRDKVELNFGGVEWISVLR